MHRNVLHQGLVQARENGYRTKFPAFSRQLLDASTKGLLGNIDKRAQFAGISSSSAIMPPKKKGLNEPNKKTEQKKKEKIIEVILDISMFLDNAFFLLSANITDFSYEQDKTFGLKNKKGKKQQTFVKQVTQQVDFFKCIPNLLWYWISLWIY